MQRNNRRLNVRILRRRAALGLALVLGAVSLGARTAQAQSLQHVTYVGGTALPGHDLHGKLAVTSTDSLVFQGSSKLVIPYDHVISYETESHRKVHVGLLTEGIWKLAAPWPEVKQLSLNYRDPNEHSQVVVLEMSKGDMALLVEILRARVTRTLASTQLHEYGR